MKIIIAIDSFKGSLSSIEAGQAAIDSIQGLLPDCQTELAPIADGGEGMLSVMMNTIKGHIQSLEAHNPRMEKIITNYGISFDGQTAFIEMANISNSFFILFCNYLRKSLILKRCRTADFRGIVIGK